MGKMLSISTTNIIDRIRSTLLSSRPPRESISRQRGMTLLEIMIVLALLGLIMGVIVVPGLMESDDKARTQTAEIQANRLVNNAFARWRLDNPGKQCPADLQDLAPYVGKNNVKDPWGRPYILQCSDSASDAGSRFEVASMGIDGKPDTGDDIRVAAE